MNIEYMREFVLLSEFKNFTAVANTTYISQPTLSRHISMLEDEVGAQLLERTKHKVELTSIGKVVYEECLQILKAYDEMLNRVSVLSEGIQGELKTGVLYYGIDEYINPVVRTFYEKYPGIQLDILSYQVHDVVRDLKERTIDVGLLMKTGELSKDKYCFHSLAKEKIYAFMSFNHPLAQEKRISFDQLSRQTILVLESEPAYTEGMEQVLKKSDFKPAKKIYTKQLDTILPVMDATGSIFLGPEMLLNMRQKYMEVREIDIPELALEIGFYYRLDNQNPAIHLFLNCITNSIKAGLSS